MTLIVRSPRAVEIATRLAEARGIDGETLVEELLDREWRAKALTEQDIERAVQGFWDKLGIKPEEIDWRPLSEIRDELWGGL
jgi:hypothetical protein